MLISIHSAVFHSINYCITIFIIICIYNTLIQIIPCDFTLRISSKIYIGPLCRICIFIINRIFWLFCIYSIINIFRFLLLLCFCILYYYFLCCAIICHCCFCILRSFFLDSFFLSLCRFCIVTFLWHPRLRSHFQNVFRIICFHF